MSLMPDITRIWPPGYLILTGIDATRTSAGDIFFYLITHLASEAVFIAVIALIYWCVDKKIGRRLSYAYLVSSGLNLFLKYLYVVPRPDSPEAHDLARRMEYPILHPLIHEPTPAFPSNHSQGSMLALIYLSWNLRKRWFWILSFVLILLIGYSRMYVCVHYPQDVNAGWIKGYVIIRIWIALEDWFCRILRRVPVGVQVAFLILVPIGLVNVFVIPEAGKILGAFSGLGIGYILECRHLAFSVDGTVAKRIYRGLIGLLMVIVVMVVPKVLLPDYDDFAGVIAALARYFLAGVTVSYLAPLVFLRTSLSSR
jgi:membrane-associated phospholipid phosphatase